MNKIIYLVIIILFILNGFLFSKLKSTIKTYESAISFISEKSEKNRKENLVFEQNVINEKTSENIVLSRDIELIDINGNVILAKDIFQENSIVLRYSEFNCKDCINAEINVLLKNKDKLKGRITFLAHYQNRRDLYVYYNEFQKKGLDNIKMYMLSENVLNIPVEKLNMPYYFSMNSDMIMTNFFIPQKDKPRLSKVYLNHAIKYIINKI